MAVDTPFPTLEELDNALERQPTLLPTLEELDAQIAAAEVSKPSPLAVPEAELQPALSEFAEFQKTSAPPPIPTLAEIDATKEQETAPIIPSLSFDPDTEQRLFFEAQQFLSAPDPHPDAPPADISRFKTKSFSTVQSAAEKQEGWPEFDVSDIAQSGVSGAIHAAGSSLRGSADMYDALTHTAENIIDAVTPEKYEEAVTEFLSTPIPWWLSPSSVLRRPGIEIQELAEEADIPEDRKNFYTDVGKGLGQMSTQIAMYMINPTVGTTALFGQGAEQAGRRAEVSGATQAEQDAAVSMGALVTGLSERLGLEKMLNRLPPEIKNGVMRNLTDIGIAGGIEAVQEVMEGIGHNLIALAVHDPDAEIFKGLKEEAEVAGTTGAIARALIRVILPSRYAPKGGIDEEVSRDIKGVDREAPSEVEAPRTEPQQAKVQKIKESVPKFTESEEEYLAGVEDAEKGIVRFADSSQVSTSYLDGYIRTLETIREVEPTAEKPSRAAIETPELVEKPVREGDTVRDAQGEEYVIREIDGNLLSYRDREGEDTTISKEEVELMPQVGDTVVGKEGQVYEVTGISDYDSLTIETELGRERQVDRDAVTLQERVEPEVVEEAPVEPEVVADTPIFSEGDLVQDKKGREFEVVDASDQSRLKLKNNQGREVQLYSKGMTISQASVKAEHTEILEGDTVTDSKGRTFEVLDSSDPDMFELKNKQGTTSLVPKQNVELYESKAVEPDKLFRGNTVADKKGNLYTVTDATDSEVVLVRDRHGKEDIFERTELTARDPENIKVGMVVRDQAGAPFTVVAVKEDGRVAVRSKRGATRVVRSASVVPEEFAVGSVAVDPQGREFKVLEHRGDNILVVKSSQGKVTKIARNKMKPKSAVKARKPKKKKAEKPVEAKVVRTEDSPKDDWLPGKAEPEKKAKVKTADVDLTKPYVFEGETEQRIREAQKGLGQHSSSIDKAKGVLTKAVEGFTRRYELLPYVRRWAKVIRVLRRIEEVPDAAKQDADIAVYSIVGKMKRRQYDDFSLMVLLDDLMFQSNENMPLPFGFTKDSLQQAHADVKARVAADPVVQKAVNDRLKLIDKLGKDLVARKLLSEDQIKNPNYFHRQVIEYAQEQSFIQRAVKKVKKKKTGWMKKRAGTDKDHNANYLEAEFAYIREAYDSIRTHDAMMDIKRLEDIYPEHKQNILEKNGALFERSNPSDADLEAFRDLQAQSTPTKLASFLKNYLGEQYIDPEGEANFPEGFVEWQYDKGKWIYTALSVPERMHEALLDAVENASKGTGIDPEVLQEVMQEFKEVAAIGKDKPKFLIPIEVAHTLDNLKPSVDRSGINASIAWTSRRWKVWRLFNPVTVPRYFLNNFVSDAEVVLTVRPGILKQVPKALWELMQVHYFHAKPSKELLEARDSGVLATGFTIQELPDINRLKKYDRLLKDKPNLVVRTVMGYWDGIKNFNQFRENWFRYAAYLYYKKRLDEGKKVGYEASIPQIVDEMETSQQKAALLASELIGDYGNLSKHGQELRETWQPFFSWTEVNLKRYTRLIKNAYSQGVGKGLAKGSVVGTVLGAKITAYLFIRLWLVYGMINAMNYMAFPDEEDDLPDHVKSTLHLIYGVDEEGNTQYIHFAGALTDFLSWIGFADVASGIVQIERGNMTLKEYLGTFEDKLKNATNKVYQGLTPFAKAPIEWTFEISTFPDIWAPRVTSTPERNLAQIMEFQAFYDIYSKHPSPGFLESTIGKMLLIKESDPEEVAYYKIREKVFAFKGEEKDQRGFSTQSDNARRALRAYRKSIRLGDKKAEDFWYDQLKQAGKSRSDIRASLQTLQPLAPLPLGDRGKFKRSLTERELEWLDKANLYYRKTFRP